MQVDHTAYGTGYQVYLPLNILYFGGISTYRCMRSGIAAASNIVNPFCASCPYYVSDIRRYLLIDNLSSNFGVNMIWYLPFHFVCDKLLLSIWIFSFDLVVSGWRTFLLLYHRRLSFSWYMYPKLSHELSYTIREL